MLNPNSRSLYTSALTPPPGMFFDEAIATTFSMDPALLLEAPVVLALMASADDQSRHDSLSTLEAIRRYSKKITVYVQQGRIQVPKIIKPNPLFGLLEEMTIEVNSPKTGVFHPKVWAIRFTSPEEETLIRLVVLTRNMTMDKSWDLSLQLEGTIGRRKAKVNKPLVHFFKSLPGFAIRDISKDRLAQISRFSDDIHRAQWELPEGFDKIAFYLPGTKKFSWKPPVSNRMAVISPFCTNEALLYLAKDAKSVDALISRPESLAAINSDTLSHFSQCLQLDDAAETEDGDEEELERPMSTGLHAKVYLFETRHYSDYTHVVVGSANATNAALLAGTNSEILVELIGKKYKVGGIDDFLGAGGLGEFLIPFESSKEVLEDTEKRVAEEYLEKAIQELISVNISLSCLAEDDEALWALYLNGNIPPLDGITSAVAWPITLMRDYAVNVLGDNSSDILLGKFSASSITGLIAFELKTKHPDVFARFVLNLPIVGVPEERNSAILKTVINNQEGFIRYLMLLLGDDTSIASSGNGSGFAKWFSMIANGEDVPLLEELIRAYSRHPNRLAEISGLIHDLSSQNPQDSVIPESFLDLWSVFEAALEGCDVK